MGWDEFWQSTAGKCKLIFCISSPRLLCGPAASVCLCAFPRKGMVRNSRCLKDNKPEAFQGELPALTTGKNQGKNWVKPLSFLPSNVYHWIHWLCPSTYTTNGLFLNKAQPGEMVTPFTQSSLEKLLSWDLGTNPKLTWDSSSPIFHKPRSICPWDSVKSLKNRVSRKDLEATFPIPPTFLNVLVNSTILCNAGGLGLVGICCREPVE